MDSKRKGPPNCHKLAPADRCLFYVSSSLFLALSLPSFPSQINEKGPRAREIQTDIVCAGCYPRAQLCATELWPLPTMSPHLLVPSAHLNGAKVVASNTRLVVSLKDRCVTKGPLSTADCLME